MSSTAAPTSASFADRARDVVARLSREDKLRTVSGADFWHTSPLAEHGVPSIMLTDGPHGLRKQQGAGDHVGLSDAAPATCFPTAVTLGSSWDVELIEEVGRALGRETRRRGRGRAARPRAEPQAPPGRRTQLRVLLRGPAAVRQGSPAALVRGIQSRASAPAPSTSR